MSFTWLGVIVGILFLETPLKFRAGVTLGAGLAIGRMVSRALNRVELGWLVVAVMSGVVGRAAASPVLACTVAAAAAKLLAVRRVLNRARTGFSPVEHLPRSRSPP